MNRRTAATHSLCSAVLKPVLLHLARVLHVCACVCVCVCVCVCACVFVCACVCVCVLAFAHINWSNVIIPLTLLCFLKCRLCVIWGRRLQLKTSVCSFQVQFVRDLGSAVTIKDECKLFSSAGCA